MTEKEVGRLGQLAVKRGLITGTQLRDALAKWESSRASGSQLPFGELLVKEELITRHHLDSLLEQQGRAQTKEFIPGYEFLKKLGKGGMGDVYLARQKSMDRMVAVKILSKTLSKDREFVDRFLREARMAGKLDHANIVRGLDVAEHAGYYYFVMEYVEGRPLDSLHPKGTAMEEEQALHVTMQVARALDFAHKRGIVHRDIKPGNILVTAGGVAKVCDMGLAKQVGGESSLTMTGVTMGTPDYISPEQARGEVNVDIRTDIYSLGATLYHLVTGQTPFSGTSAAVILTKHLTEEVPWPQELNPSVSHHVCMVTRKMMAKKAEDRYTTPADLLTDLELVIDGKRPVKAQMGFAKSTVRKAPGKAEAASPSARKRPPTSPAAGSGEAPERRKRSAGLIWGLAAAGVVALAFAGFLATRSRDAPARSALKRPASAEKTVEKPVGRAASADRNQQEIFEYAEKWAGEHPEEYDEAIVKHRLVVERAAGTVWALKASDAMREIEGKRDEAARAAFAGIEKKALALAEAGDYNGAVAVYGELPEKFETVLKPRADAAAEKLRTEKEDREREAREKAERAAAEREKAEAAAKQKRDDLWARFDEKLLAGDVAGAKTLVRSAAGEDPLLKGEPLSSLMSEIEKFREAEAKARESVKGLIGKKIVLQTADGEKKGVVRAVTADAIEIDVEIRMENASGMARQKIAFDELAEEERDRLIPKVEPTSDGGRLASAILAMASKDLDAAVKAFASIADHPLKERYEEKLAVLRGSETRTPAASKPTESTAGVRAPTGQRPTAYKAVWKKMEPGYVERDGKSPVEKLKWRAGTPGFTYDSKRKWCVLYGGGRNDMWAYDGAKNVWACLEEDVPGDGTRGPDIARSGGSCPLAYDPAGDCYWTASGGALWSYDPSSHAWKKRSETGESIMGLGYSRKTGRLAGICGKGDMSEGACFVDCRAGTVKGAGEFPLTNMGRGSWTSAGGLGSSDEQGCFLVFSGVRKFAVQDEAWMWDTSRDKWSPVSTAKGPLPRSYGSVMYHSRLCMWVLHGGRGGETGTKTTGLKDLADTWVYDPVRKNWMQAACANTPDEDTRPGSFVYDQDRDRGVLFQHVKSLETWTLELVPEGSAARSAAPRAASVTPKPATSPTRARSYTAAWEKRDAQWGAGVLEGLRSAGRDDLVFLYDTARKLCVMTPLLEDRGSSPGSVVAYDVRANTWTNILTAAPELQGPLKRAGGGRAGIAYDPAADRYLIPRAHTLWSFSPATRKWEKLLEAEKSITIIGYNPGTRSVIEMETLHRWMRRFDLTSGKGRNLKPSPFVNRHGVSSGFLSSPGSDGRYLFFGGGMPGRMGERVNTTWLYDPRTDEYEEVKCAQSPPPRGYGRLSYNSKLGVWVLFGGVDPDKKKLYDMWVYNGALKTWIEVKSSGADGLRGGFGYDPGNDVHVMLSMATYRPETWVCRIRAGK